MEDSEDRSGEDQTPRMLRRAVMGDAELDMQRVVPNEVWRNADGGDQTPWVPRRVVLAGTPGFTCEVLKDSEIKCLEMLYRTVLADTPDWTCNA